MENKEYYRSLAISLDGGLRRKQNEITLEVNTIKVERKYLSELITFLQIDAGDASGVLFGKDENQEYKNKELDDIREVFTSKGYHAAIQSAINSVKQIEKWLSKFDKEIEKVLEPNAEVMDNSGKEETKSEMNTEKQIEKLVKLEQQIEAYSQSVIDGRNNIGLVIEQNNKLLQQREQLNHSEKCKALIDEIIAINLSSMKLCVANIEAANQHIDELVEKHNAIAEELRNSSTEEA
jgi:hypothetical protein